VSIKNEIGFVLKLSATQFKAGASAATSSLQKLDLAAKKIGKSLDQHTGRALKRTTQAFTGLMAASTVVGARFDREMTFMGAITNATASDMENMTGKARELGKTTMFSATEAAQAMQNLARAGMDTNEIMEASGPALMLAGAAGTDMKTATDLLAASLAQFNLDSSESSRVTDVFATAITNSLFDVNSLKEAMKYAGTVGQAFGMSIEESTAAVAQFRNIGLEGSLAGTNFRMAMQSAAVSTEKKRKTLERLGLTMADINPQYHTFGDILEKLGSTTSDVGDALEIFGRRAGANMAGLIDNARQGNDEYGELLSTLESSVGATERLYQQATDNILDQAIIVKSAFQDILLSIFGTYKEPMSNMLTTIATSLNKTSESIQADADKTESTWTRMMERIEVFFIINATMWGEKITSLMIIMAELVTTFITLIPILADIAMVMGTIWAVGRVRAFATMITGVVIPAMKGLTTATVAAGAAQIGVGATSKKAFFSKAGLAVLGKGLAKGALRLTGYGTAIYLATKLVGPFSRGLRKIFGMTNNVGDAQAEAAEKMREYREGLEEISRQEAVLYRKGATVTNEWARAKLKAGLASKSLTNSQRHELTVLADLEGSQAKAAVSAGQMIVVYRELHGVQQMMFQTQRQIADAIALGEQDSATDEEWLASAQAKNDQLMARKNMEDEYYQGTAKQLRELRVLLENLNQPTGIQRRHRLELLEAQYGNIFAAKVMLGLLEEQSGIEFGRLEANKRNAEIELERAKARIQATKDAAKAKRGREVDASAKKFQSDWEAALKAVDKAHQKVFENWQDSSITDAEKSVLEFQRRTVELQKTYQKAIDLVGEASRRGRQLTASFFADVAMMEETVANKYARRTRDASREAGHQMYEDAQRLSQDAAKIRSNLAIKAEEELAKAAIEIAGKNEEAVAVIEKAFRERKAFMEYELSNTISETNREHAEEASDALTELLESDQNKRLQITKTWNRKINELHASDVDTRRIYERTMIEELMQYDRELRRETYEYVGRETEANLMDLNRKLRTASDIQNTILRAQFEAVVLGQIDEQKKRLWLEQNFGFVLSELGELGQEIAYQFAGVFRGIARATVGFWTTMAPAISGVFSAVFGFMGDGAENVGSLIKHAIGGAIESVWKLVKGPLAKGFKVISKSVKGVAFALKAVKASVGAIVGLVGQVGGAWGKVTDTVARFTGLSVDVLGTLGDARDLMKERAELQEQINSGELSGDQLTDARANLAAMPATAGAAAAQLIADQFTEATSFFKDLASTLPAMFAEIMAQVPVFVAAIGETIPGLMGVLANNVGPLVNALLDGVLTLVDVLIDSLPNVIIAITDMIPGLIGKLMDAAPRILEFVFEAIAYIIGEIPKFIDVIVAKLPTLITSLMNGLVDVVVALMKAAPKILKSLADALPTLLAPLMEGVIAIILGIAENLGPLILAIAGAIPDIFAAIINVLPQLAFAVIKVLPQLFIAIVQLLPVIWTALWLMIPRFFEALGTSMKALLTDAFNSVQDWFANIDLGDLGRAIKDAVLDGLRQMVVFFKDVFKEIKSLGKANTETFGDTPRVMLAGQSGAMTRFAPGDLFLAAKTPENLMKQMAASFGSVGVGTPSAPQMDLSSIPAMVSSLGSAVLTSGGSGGGGDLRVTVVAEGKTLDDVLYTAGKRGHTPSLKQDLRRASGATVGLDRGRFSSQS
jgi:TP901 family phage tail tape measure protein